MGAVETVQASFARCDSPEFYDSIYDTFLAKSDEVRTLFADTEFKRQKVLLRSTVTIMVRFQLPDPRAQTVFESVGKSHNRQGYNIGPALYGIWLESLLESIDKHDPLSSPETADAWREYLKPGIDLILAAY